MTRPPAGEEAQHEWLNTRRGLQLLRLGLLVFLLAFAVAWAVGAVFAVLVLWRHGKHPTVAVFLGAWLLLWAAIPVWFVQAFGRAREARQRGTAVKSFGRWRAVFFVGCFAVGWLAGLVGVWRRGDHLGGSLLSAFTAVVFVPFIVDVLHRRTVSADPLATSAQTTVVPHRSTLRGAHEIGLVSTTEGVGRYALQRVGALEVEGDWYSATARADEANWRFVGSSPWALRRSASATDAVGSVIGG
jgi:hypothetical protein